MITDLGAEGSTTQTDLQGINGNLSGQYVLGADIDASATSGWNFDTGFTPLGDSGNDFIGTFDGLGHVITGFIINRPSSDYVGLFGYVDSGGVVRNIGLEGGSVSGHDVVGGLVGWNSGTITQTYATGIISGNNYVGGLVGRNYGTITQTYATGAVSGNTYVGGLAGAGRGTITQTYATGAVSGDSHIGGLVGWNDDEGTITQTYATGAVSSNTYVGGLVGRNYGTVTDSFYDQETTGQSDTDRGTPKTTAEMKTKSTFTGANWDFSTVWGMKSSLNSRYPVLRIFNSSEVFPTDLTITLASTSKTYGDANPTLGSFTLDGCTNCVTAIDWGGGVTSTSTVGNYAYDGSAVLTLTWSESFSTDEYDIIFADSVGLTIDPRAVSLSGNRTYDGTVDLAAAIFTLGNLVEGQNLTLTGTGGMGDKNAGDDKTVTITGLALGGTDKDNYTLDDATATAIANIAQAAITAITGITAGDKIYDGTTDATLSTADAGFTGKIAGDALTVASATGAFADKNAGDDKTVTITGLALGGTDKDNYTLDDATATAIANIAPRAVSLSGSRVYDGTVDLAAAIFTLGNLVEGQNLTLTGT
ncbi:MAG: hypothetical protein FD187_3185, partial [bacterium]